MYIIIRKEKHIDDKVWVFDDWNKAYKAFHDLVEFWAGEYGEYESEYNDENFVIQEDEHKVYQAESFSVELTKPEVWR